MGREGLTKSEFEKSINGFVIGAVQVGHVVCLNFHLTIDVCCVFTLPPDLYNIRSVHEGTLILSLESKMFVPMSYLYVGGNLIGASLKPASMSLSSIPSRS